MLSFCLCVCDCRIRRGYGSRRNAPPLLWGRPVPVACLHLAQQTTAATQVSPCMDREAEDAQRPGAECVLHYTLLVVMTILLPFSESDQFRLSLPRSFSSFNSFILYKSAAFSAVVTHVLMYVYQYITYYSIHSLHRVFKSKSCSHFLIAAFIAFADHCDSVKPPSDLPAVHKADRNENLFFLFH